MFISDLMVRELADGKKQLALPLLYLHDGVPFVVPVGFITDYASVPRTPFIYWIFNGVANRAATLHDFLYSSASIPRKVADEIFLSAMIEDNTSDVKAYAMYFAVRLFGKCVREKAYGFINE